MVGNNNLAVQIFESFCRCTYYLLDIYIQLLGEEVLVNRPARPASTMDSAARPSLPRA